MKLRGISILLALVATLVMIVQNGQTNASDVAELIQNYYKCEHLKSSPKDSFYKSKGLANMDFEQAMAFIRKIYLDTKNCDTDYCKCVDEYIDDHSILFRTDSYYDGLRSILLALNNKYNTKPYWKSLRDSFKYVREGEKYPTIVQFLMKYEYTSNKLNFYNNVSNCEVGLSNPENAVACSYFATVDNRVAILEPTTNGQIENQMICELMNIADCQDVEMRRFQAMQMWVERYSNLRIGGRLTDYFDNLISKSKNYQPKFKFGIVSIIKSDTDFFFKAFKATTPSQIGLGHSELESSYVCLNSSQLRVDCHMKQLPNEKVTFSRFIFNFYLPKGSNPPSLRFAFDGSTREHGKIFKDKSGTNIYQVFAAEFGMTMYDFNSNSLMTAGPDHFVAYSPVSMLNSSSGILIDGHQEEYVPLQRKAKTSEECENICNRLFVQMFENKHGNNIVNAVYEKCIKECV